MHPQSTIPLGLCQCGCGQTTRVTERSCASRGLVRGQPRRYVQGHGSSRPLETRFWRKVARTVTCWLWLAARARGYGVIGHSRSAGYHLAHHYAWYLASGEWPQPGQVVGHVCDVRRCVRNDGPLGAYEVDGILLPRYGHLFLGTQANNVADMMAKGRFRGATGYRSARCQRGLHDWTPDNTLIRQGKRVCRACFDAYQTTYNQARRGRHRIDQASAHQNPPAPGPDGILIVK